MCVGKMKISCTQAQGDRSSDKQIHSSSLKTERQFVLIQHKDNTLTQCFDFWLQHTEVASWTVTVLTDK